MTRPAPPPLSSDGDYSPANTQLDSEDSDNIVVKHNKSKVREQVDRKETFSDTDSVVDSHFGIDELPEDAEESCDYYFSDDEEPVTWTEDDLEEMRSLVLDLSPSPPTQLCDEKRQANS